MLGRSRIFRTDFPGHVLRESRGESTTRPSRRDRRSSAWETRDRHTPGAAQLTCFESARCPGTRIFHYPKQSLSNCTLPTISQAGVGSFLIPVSLLDNIVRCGVAEVNPRSLHRRRVRSRSAATRPFRRRSATGISIFEPFAAAIRSCSRVCRRRSLSWRISSRTYSLGVPQSPEATCPSTYCFNASGSEIFSDVIAMPSYYGSL
jgi:hypothetical protein